MDLQQISDRIEIQDVLVRYTRAIDTGEWDRLDTVFTPDAEIDYTESGGIVDTYPAVKPWLAEMLPMFFPKRMHTLGQVDITLDGDEALCSAYFHNPMSLTVPDGQSGQSGQGGQGGQGGERIVELGGIYHHTMVRTPDGWRSRKLHEEVVWKRGL